MEGLPILTEAQLRKLAYVIYRQEANAISNLKFGSEFERAKYLNDCKESYETALSLLDSGVKVETEHRKDEVKGPIAQDIYGYIVHAVGFSCEAVRNSCLRLNYLMKIKEHANYVITALKSLKQGDAINARLLAKDAALYRNAMMEYTRKYQTAASRNFAKWLKSTGLRFDQLVQTYQNKRQFVGPFSELEKEQKITVFEDIMEASGRGRVWINNAVTAAGVAGMGLILLTGGIMLWDIISSEHVFRTATRDAVDALAPVAGAYLADVITTAIEAEIIEGLELSALFVTAVGMLASIAGAFIIGAFVGLLLDLIFESGGTAPLSTDGLKCYLAPMPDCAALAYQIIHEDNNSDTPHPE